MADPIPLDRYRDRFPSVSRSTTPSPIEEALKDGLSTGYRRAARASRKMSRLANINKLSAAQALRELAELFDRLEENYK